MAATEINGNPEAISAITSQIKAPPMPQSLLARMGMPLDLAGMFEGGLWSVVDKAVTAMHTAVIGNNTQKLATASTSGKAVAVTYKAADIGSAFDLATAAEKLVTQGIGVVQKAKSAATSTGTSAGTATAASTGTAAGTSTGTSAGSAPKTTV